MTNLLCEDIEKCALSNPNANANWCCTPCIRSASDDREKLYGSPFTPEEIEEIEKFLDNNKELMEDLAKGD